MAETIHGPSGQTYHAHNLDDDRLDGEAKATPTKATGVTAPDGHHHRDAGEAPEDGAALTALVRGLVGAPGSPEAFHRALHRDAELCGRSPTREELVDLIVRRIVAGTLVLEPFATNVKTLGGGTEQGHTEIKEPPKKEPEKEKEKVCKLEHATLECSHEVGGKARKPKDGVLEVVPAEAGDKIKVEGEWEGGCGDHPKWSVTGFWTTTEKKAAMSFNARPWFVGSPTGTMMLRWLSGVAPKTYSVKATGCSGSKSFTVKSYPADKLTVTLAGEQWHAMTEKIEWFVDHVLGKFFKNPHFEILKGKASVSAAWAEWKDHTAYYKWEAAVGFNPLIAAKFRIPFGPTAAIPQWMKDLTGTEAGFFAEFAGGINVNGKWTRATPEKAKMFAEAQGFVYGKLGAELKFASKKVLAIEVAGKTGISMTAAPDYKVEKPTLLIELKWEGVKGLVTATAAWGWIEIEHEFNLIDEQTIWEKHPFELVHENAA